MRYFEIVLKVAFLAGAVHLLLTNPVRTCYMVAFLILSAILGAVLIFNKKASYHYKQTKRDYMIRRIEGVFLVLFALAGGFSIFY
jgi:hypothetical protein